MSNASTPRNDSPGPSASAPGTTSHKHALTAVEKQRSQLERLLKDPAKPVYIPAPPKEKGIRPPREMMKNVQGSSAGAGSGEFHVYKAARRREYERLKLLEEEAQKETIASEFEKKRKEAEAIAEAKTAKNRAKRQKKKQLQKKAASNAKDAAAGSGGEDDNGDGESKPKKSNDGGNSAPLKKRRLINGQELVFKRPGEDDDDASDDEEVGPQQPQKVGQEPEPALQPTAKVVGNKITIIEDD